MRTWIRFAAACLSALTVLVTVSCAGGTGQTGSGNSSQESTGGTVTSHDIISEIGSGGLESGPEDPVSSEAPSDVSSDSNSDTPSGGVSGTESSGAPEDENDGIDLKGPLGSDELACFEDAAFIGNSIMKSLFNYRVIPTADFFTRSSLNVRSVYTTSTDTGTVPIIDMIDTRQGAEAYSDVFLLFGLNEMGYHLNSFINLYGQLVDDVKVRQPGATVYVLSVFPVTAKTSGTSQTGVTNENIVRMNESIREMCAQRGAVYVDVYSHLINKNGCLPDNVSTDGIHLNKICSQHVAACIYEEVFGKKAFEEEENV